jgi:hypothetical protein
MSKKIKIQLPLFAPVSILASDNATKSIKTHGGHPDFYKLLGDMAKIHSKKNHDYAGIDPLSNFKMSEDINVPAHIGAFIRLSDKWKRAAEFFKSNTLKVADETIEDTLMDLAVYSLIVILLYRERSAI